MRRFLPCALLGSALLLQAQAPARAPVLVELFTSEGCSSCPPADRLLQQLDSQAIVMSEHVTYWNQEGWRDPFSSAEFTARQTDYCRKLTVDSPYTPEMVIDGAAEFSGNLRDRVVQEIARVSRETKVDLRLARDGDSLQIDADPSSLSGNIFLAVADDSEVSQVTAGENKGQELRHVAVVRSIRRIGALKPGGSFHQLVKLPYGSPSQRFIVFVQEPGPGRVHGAAMLPPSR
jgi:hypothetical protein